MKTEECRGSVNERGNDFREDGCIYISESKEGFRRSWLAFVHRCNATIDISFLHHGQLVSTDQMAC